MRASGWSVSCPLSSTRTDDLLQSGESTASALTSGYHLAFVIGAGLVVVAFGVAATVLRAPEPAVAIEEARAEPAYSEAV